MWLKVYTVRDRGRRFHKEDFEWAIPKDVKPRKKYDKEIKKLAIAAYDRGTMFLTEICSLYSIPRKDTLVIWIRVEKRANFFLVWILNLHVKFRKTDLWKGCIVADKRLGKVNAFCDLGDYYVSGRETGEVYDSSIISLSGGTHIVTSTDGSLVTYFESADTACGTRAVETKILSSICTMMDNGDDTFSILGAVGNEAYIIRQDGNGLAESLKINITAPDGAVSLVRYVPLKIEDGYKVLTVWSTPEENVFSIGYFEISDGTVSNNLDTGLVSSRPDVKWVDLDGDDCVSYEWQGCAYVDVAVPVYDRVIRSRRVGSSSAGRLIGSYENSIYFIDDDGVLSAFDAAHSDVVMWSTNTGDSSIDRLEAVTCGSAIHLFPFSSSSGTLYHCPLVKDRTSGSYVIFPIDSTLTGFSVTDTGSGIDLCLVSDTHIAHSHLDPVTFSWIDRPVVIDSEDDFRKITGHISDITLYDADGCLLPSHEVRLWTNERTRLIINGRSVNVSPDMQYDVTSDENGRIEVIEESESMNGSALIIRDKDDELAPYHVITAGEKYKAKFRTIGKDDLDKARTGDGKNLVDDDFGCQRSEVLDSAARSMNSMLEGTLVNENPDLNRIRIKDDAEANLMVSSFREDPTAYLSAIAKANGHKSFVIDFSTGTASYREINKEEAENQIRMMCTRAYGESWHPAALHPSDGFFSAIGSFFKAIVKGIVKVVKIVVHVVEEAVNAVVSFIGNAVEQVANFAITVIKDAVHLVESVLSKISVHLGKIIKWIGFMLDWSDIKKCAEHVESMFENGFVLMDGWLCKIETGAGKAVPEAEAKIREFLGLPDSGIADIDCKDDKGFSKQDNPVNEANAHNIFMKHLSDTAKSNDEIDILSSSAIDDFLDALTGLESVAEKQGYDDLIDLCLGACTTRNIASLVRKLVSDILDDVFAIADDVVSKLAASARKLLAVLKSALTHKIRIPFLSSLFKFVTGMDLTVLNLCSFAVALPSTIAYKLIYHEAPVSDDGLLRKNGNLEKNLLLISVGVYSGAQSIAIWQLATIRGKLIMPLVSIINILAVLMAGIIMYQILEDGSSWGGTDFWLCSVIALFQCILDFYYLTFKVRGKLLYYHNMKAFFVFIGCLLSLLYISDISKSITFPGGMMYSIPEMIKSAFYRTRQGELRILAAIPALTGAATVVMELKWI